MTMEGPIPNSARFMKLFEKTIKIWITDINSLDMWDRNKIVS